MLTTSDELSLRLLRIYTYNSMVMHSSNQAHTDRIAFELWRQDVAKSLAFQWVLLVLVVCACGLFGLSIALNAVIAGLAIAIPNTALGAWMGLRLWIGKASAAGVFIGGALKTLFSVVLIGAAFAVLQELGWVWQGFLAGLISMVLSPLAFGIFTASRQ